MAEDYYMPLHFRWEAAFDNVSDNNLRPFLKAVFAFGKHFAFGEEEHVAPSTDFTGSENTFLSWIKTDVENYYSQVAKHRKKKRERGDYRRDRERDNNIQKNTEKKDRETHTHREACDPRPEVSEIINLYPEEKRCDNERVKATILDAIAREVGNGKTESEAIEQIKRGTTAYAEAVAKWPNEQKRFVTHPVNFFQQGMYNHAPETFVRKKPYDMADPTTW